MQVVFGCIVAISTMLCAIAAEAGASGCKRLSYLPRAGRYWTRYWVPNLAGQNSVYLSMSSCWRSRMANENTQKCTLSADI
jgi:hypothetical protein